MMVKHGKTFSLNELSIEFSFSSLTAKNGASSMGRPFCPKHAPIRLDSTNGQSIVGVIRVGQRTRSAVGTSCRIGW